MGSRFLLGCVVLCLSACWQQQLSQGKLGFAPESVLIQMNEDSGFESPAPGVLKNFHLEPEKEYAVRVLSDVFNGTLVLNGNGAFAYKPNEDFFGTDSFLYQLVEKDRVVYEGTVQFEVKNIPDSPKAQGENYTLKEDALLVIGAPGVLENDRDPDGGTLVLSLGENPQHGELTLNPDGSFRFKPEMNWSGETAFTYTVASGEKQSEPVTVGLSVEAINDRPRLRLGTMSIEEGKSVLITNEIMLGEDVDDESEELKFAVKNLEHGRFELKQNPGKNLKAFSQSHITKGNVTFIHNGSEQPPAFIIELSDGKLSVEQRMNIDFKAENDVPQWRRAQFAIKEGEQLELTDLLITAVDEETDTDQLSFEVKTIIGLRLVDGQDKEKQRFTMKDIREKSLKLIHDGSETRPQLQLVLSDGEHQLERDIKIGYTAVNDAPKWQHSGLSITQGQQTILDTTQIHIVDDDHVDTDLVIKVLQAKHLRFAHIDVPETSIHQWSNHALKEKKIIAIHDGSVEAPLCVLQVGDGKLHSDQEIAVSFTRIYKPPVIVGPARVAFVARLPINEIIGKHLQIALSDPDSADLVSVRVSLSLMVEGETLSVPAHPSISASWAAGKLSLAGAAPLSAYQELLDRLHYVGVYELGDSFVRGLDIEVFDGEKSSLIHHIDMDISPMVEPDPAPPVAPAVAIPGSEKIPATLEAETAPSEQNEEKPVE